MIDFQTGCICYISASYCLVIKDLKDILSLLKVSWVTIRNRLTGGSSRWIVTVV